MSSRGNNVHPVGAAGGGGGGDDNGGDKQQPQPQQAQLTPETARRAKYAIKSQASLRKSSGLSSRTFDAENSTTIAVGQDTYTIGKSKRIGRKEGQLLLFCWQYASVRTYVRKFCAGWRYERKWDICLQKKEKK